jgi:hypothetical protein
MQNILNILTIISGGVAVIQLLEYIFTKNIPWLVRLLMRATRWLKRKLGWTQVPPGQRYLVLNFSSHLILPNQQQTIQKKMSWPAIEVIDARLGNVAENRNFAATLVNHIEKIDLLPNEWQTSPMVVVPAGYAPAWAVLLAELHGRLGYFPDVVRLRPASAHAEEKFEVAEVVPLREIRGQARGKR